MANRGPAEECACSALRTRHMPAAPASRVTGGDAGVTGLGAGLLGQKRCFRGGQGDVGECARVRHAHVGERTMRQECVCTCGQGCGSCWTRCLCHVSVRTCVGCTPVCRGRAHTHRKGHVQARGRMCMCVCSLLQPHSVVLGCTKLCAHWPTQAESEPGLSQSVSSAWPHPEKHPK